MQFTVMRRLVTSRLHPTHTHTNVQAKEKLQSVNAQQNQQN